MIKAYVLLFLVMCLSGGSFARAFNVTASPYFGISGSSTSVEYANYNGIDYSAAMPKKFMGLGAHFGMEMHENLAMEIGYDATQKESAEVSGVTGISSLSAKLNAIRVDIMPKIRTGNDMQLVGILGIVSGVNSVQLNKHDASVEGKFQQGGFSNGYQYGVGIWKDLSHNSMTRFEYRKQFLDYGGIANQVEMISVGISFKM